MKLLSLSVENFRCIRKAEIEFGPGLNVLHGPNDLGKSSLATAIRAALLMQPSSRESQEFVSWDGAGDPVVKLVFESEPQRIWRVRKNFGATGEAFLDESRDGVDFHVAARARDVDGQLSGILKWGLAPPGLKGRPRGMPMTFLSTALLAEQDKVAEIFAQALSEDSDESGKKRLIEALQAIAENPLFKAVLGSVQARVDEAFTSTGKKKGGKNSPWMEIRESVSKASDWLRQCNEQLQKTHGIETELGDLRSQRLQGQDALAKAQGLLEQIEESHRQGERRQVLLEQLREREKAMNEIAATIRLRDEAEASYRESARQAEALTQREGVARRVLADAQSLLERAKDEAARLRSEDRVSERLLQQQSLKQTRAELETREARNAARRAGVDRALEFDGQVPELDAKLRRLEASAGKLGQRHADCVAALAAADREATELQALGRWFRLSEAKAELRGAEEGLAQVMAWREAAVQKRKEAAALQADAPANLPTVAQLENWTRLEQEIRVERAKLDVGLQVSIRPKRGLRLRIRQDGGPAAVHDLHTSPMEFPALQIGRASCRERV